MWPGPPLLPQLLFEICILEPEVGQMGLCAVLLVLWLGVPESGLNHTCRNLVYAVSPFACYTNLITHRAPARADGAGTEQGYRSLCTFPLGPLPTERRPSPPW